MWQKQKRKKYAVKVQSEVIGTSWQLSLVLYIYVQSFHILKKKKQLGMTENLVIFSPANLYVVR